MSDLLFQTSPLARLGNAAAAGPAKPGKTEFGGNVSVGSFHQEWSIPAPPKTVIENEYIRFKIQLEAKWEVVGEVKSRVGATADFKVNPTDPRLNVQVGTRAWLTDTIEASAKVKISPNSLEGLDATAKDPRKFGLALLKYLEVVLGKQFKIDCQYVKFIGAGLTWDADYCFFSVLVPVTIPVVNAGGTANAGMRLSTQAVIKFGPGKKLFHLLAKLPVARRLAVNMLVGLKRMGQRLPSVLAKEVAVAVEAAAAEAGEVAVAEGVLATTTAGSAAWAAFCTWAGVAMLAVPIGISVAEFSVATCRAARERGVRFGDLNLYAQTYVRRVYGLEVFFQGLPHSQEVKQLAIAEADEDMLEHGQFYLRRYLENSWYDGRQPVGVRQVDVLAERFWLFLNRRFGG